MSLKDKELTQESLKELLHYNPLTGEFTWKERSSKWMEDERNRRSWNAKFAGKPAGTLFTKSKTGYQSIELCIFNKKYRAHRLAWLYMTGHLPEQQIDHIDQDARNNKWVNLREASFRDNSRNRCIHNNNTSGVVGVVWRKDRSKWAAQCGMGNKTHYLGEFDYDDLDLAAMTVMEFRAEHGFDPMHGMEHAHYHKGA